MSIKKTLQGIFWILVYILLTLAPVLILLLGSPPPGREFWRDFSVAIGYCAIAMWMLQFVLTARFKVIKAPYGSDIVYYFHKQISIVAYILAISHVLILFIFSPKLISLLNFFTAPLRARAAVLSLLAVSALIFTSVYRKKWRIEYNRWRIWHGILAIAAVSFAFAHIYLAGYYLNTLLKRELWIIYSLFWIGLIFYVRVYKPWVLIKNPFLVDEIKPERGGAYTLVLKPKHRKVFHFQAGQFAWLTANHTPFSDTEHPFTIASSAENRETISFTIKELGDFTSTIKTLVPGQEVFVDGPFGAFSYERHPHAQGFMFIAGGIGITPMMSMLRSLADRHDKRPHVLVYANKNWEGVTFCEEIQDLQKTLDLKVVHVLETPPEDWTGETGFVNAGILKKNLPKDLPPNSWEVFICGPLPMMNAVENLMPAAGVSIGDFHSERFDLV
jgi:3-phenylpropionate/trans-cinnamate dioxygenase ferredoxin reductase subunit